MKSLIKIFFALIVIISFFDSNVYAQSNSIVFDINTHLLSESLAEKVVELNIDTKKDSEVFSIIGNTNFFSFDYINENNDLSFSSDFESFETVFSSLDSGFKVCSEISSPIDNKFSQVNVNIPDTWYINYATDENNNQNGSLGIYNELGEPVASTGLITAVDALGNNIEAHFFIENNSIFVKLNDTNISYPVNISYGVYAVNTKRSITNYFHYVGFNLIYSGSLTLGPRYFDEGSVIECTNAWNAVYKLYYPYNPYWTNSTQTRSMKDQYWCHADFARNKPQWNLEPWRPVVSWSKMISKRCNP